MYAAPLSKGLVATSLLSLGGPRSLHLSLSLMESGPTLLSFFRGRAPQPPLSSVESGPAHPGSSFGSARSRPVLWRGSSVAPSANTLPPRGVCAECVPQLRSRGESPASLSLSLSFSSFALYSCMCMLSDVCMLLVVSHYSSDHVHVFSYSPNIVVSDCIFYSADAIWC